MALEFDRSSQMLWAVCDNHCDGNSETFSLQEGRFQSVGMYQRPEGMENLNSEGFALENLGYVSGSMYATCASEKGVFWSDDDNKNGHSIW